MSTLHVPYRSLAYVARRLIASRTLSTTATAGSTTLFHGGVDGVPGCGRVGAASSASLHPVAHPDQILHRRHLRSAAAAARSRPPPTCRRTAGGHLAGQGRRSCGRPADAVQRACSVTSRSWSSASSRSASSVAVRHHRAHRGIEVLLLGATGAGTARRMITSATSRRRSSAGVGQPVAQARAGRGARRRSTSTTLRPVVSPPIGGSGGRFSSGTAAGRYPNRTSRQTPQTQRLSWYEGRMTDTAVDEVVGLCRDLLRIDTTNTGDPRTTVGERVAAEYVAEQLTEVGIEVADPRVGAEAGQPGRPDPRRRPAPAARCWCTATSTWCRPTPSEWSVPPFSGEEKDGYLWGRGAIDMKDFDAMMLAVVRRLAAHRRTSRRATSCSPSPPTRRPAWSTARSSWSASTPTCSTGCTEAIGEVGGFSYTVNDDLRLYLVRDRREGHRLAAPARPRPPRARLVRARRQRGHRAGRGRRRGRPAPVPDGRHPDRARVPGAGLRRARHRARPGRPGDWRSPSSARSPT